MDADSLRLALGDVAVCDEALEHAWSTARAAHPSITLSPNVFGAHLATCLRGPDFDRDLAALHVADVYLACGCVNGDESALETLDRVHLSRVGEWIAHVGGTSSFVDDVRQDIAQQLILGTGASGPKLRGYTGHGALGAFIRVMATRLAQKRKKRQSERAHDEPDAAIAAPDLDPELALLKRRFAKEFAEAFAAVLASLEIDERNVLKLHYLDGLSIDEVGVAYRVSRATAARWLAKARSRVVDETQRRLAERLGRSAPNADSLLAMVQSDLHLSLSRIIR